MSARRFHARIGYMGLLVSVIAGLVMEALLAWKTPAVLDAGNETRRLLFRLAHAHLAGLSVVHLSMAGLEPQEEQPGPRPRSSSLLGLGTLLVPFGFLLGGLFAHGSDPGVGVLFVPAGALALAAGFFARARAAR